MALLLNGAYCRKGCARAWIAPHLRQAYEHKPTDPWVVSLRGLEVAMRVIASLGLLFGLACAGAPEIPAPAPAPAPVPTPVPVAASVFLGFESDTEGCSVHLRSPQSDRHLGRLPGACPLNATWIVQPGGEKVLLLIHNNAKSTLYQLDMRLSQFNLLPNHDTLVARWSKEGVPLILSSEDIDVQEDATGKYITVDGNIHRLDPDEAHAVEVRLGRSWILSNGAWVAQKIILLYYNEGMSMEDAVSDEELGGIGFVLGQREGNKGDLPNAESPDLPGTWYVDGQVASAGEWLEGLMVQAPVAIHLQNGHWQQIAGLKDGSSVAWEQQEGMVILHSEGKHQAFGLNDGHLIAASSFPFYFWPSALVPLLTATPAPVGTPLAVPPAAPINIGQVSIDKNPSEPENPPQKGPPHRPRSPR